jgi:hypothetical protein
MPALLLAQVAACDASPDCDGRTRPLECSFTRVGALREVATVAPGAADIDGDGTDELAVLGAAGHKFGLHRITGDGAVTMLPIEDPDATEVALLGDVWGEAGSEVGVYVPTAGSIAVVSMVDGLPERRDLPMSGIVTDNGRIEVGIASLPGDLDGGGRADLVAQVRNRAGEVKVGAWPGEDWQAAPAWSFDAWPRDEYWFDHHDLWIAPAGDLNGDGIPAFAIGNGDDGYPPSSVRIYEGPDPAWSAPVASVVVTNAKEWTRTGLWPGPAPNTDLDGDGNADLVIASVERGYAWDPDNVPAPQIMAFHGDIPAGATIEDASAWWGQGDGSSTTPGATWKRPGQWSRRRWEPPGTCRARRAPPGWRTDCRSPGCSGWGASSRSRFAG